MKQLPPPAPARFEVRVLPDLESLAEEAAGEFRRAASEGMRRRSFFRVALAGGSTPRLLHEQLVRERGRFRIEWKRVRFFFGDERCVPPDNERSNYRMARETLFDPIGISADEVFRMRGEGEPHAAADEYARTLEREFARSRSGPRFDLVLLGLGP